MNPFISAEELKASCQLPAKVIIWGTNEYARQVLRTLDAHGIPVDCFGDNNPVRQGTKFEGRPVISVKTASAFCRPLVIIASYWYRDILKQLEEAGIKDAFVLEECLKITFKELLEDRQYLSGYFHTEDVKTGRILIELYGNLGDVVICSGIIRHLLSFFGYEKVYFLVEDIWEDSIAEYIRLFTAHVFSINQKRYVECCSYRRDFLAGLNRMYFDAAVCLCPQIATSRRRYINQYLFNAKRQYICKDTAVYWPDTYACFLEKIFPGFETGVSCLQGSAPARAIERALSESFIFPNPYAAIHMGATDPLRRCEVKQILPAIQYLFGEGFSIVILGKGEYDEHFAGKLIKEAGGGNHGKIINMVSRLSISQSAAVINRAEFFLGTDSGMWNLSVALGKESVVLYGGGEYGAFLHPSKNVYYVTVDERECFGCRWYCTNRNKYGKSHCINDISPEMIIGGIRKLLDRRKDHGNNMGQLHCGHWRSRDDWKLHGAHAQ